MAIFYKKSINISPALTCWRTTLSCHALNVINTSTHSTKKPVTTMLTYPWKCTVLHCNHLKPLVLMTRHFDYCLSTSEGDNQSVKSSAPVVSRCFPGGYNVKLYISRGRLACWLLAFYLPPVFENGGRYCFGFGRRLRRLRGCFALYLGCY